MRRRASIFFPLLSIFFSLFIVFLIPVVLFIKPYLPFVNYLLGQNKPTSYLVLLGNDTEIRTNGGFVGSYAKVSLSYPQYSFSFQDIYVPDGQLQGYVTPPAPIQEAFQHGTWQLSNADWEPDFPTTATTLRWFFEKGGEINPDNLVLLNLSTIKKVLDVVGTVSVPEYSASLTPDNLYLFLQGKAETNFFPGSTQKKDALTAVGSALLKKFQTLSIFQKFNIAQILYQDLLNQNILINSTNQDFQALLEAKNFAGKLTTSTPDTYLLIETNLGANKANAYVTRETSHVISFENGQTTHQVTLKLVNSSPQSNPNPPFNYGGDYRAYLRFYIPASAQNIQVASASGALKFTPVQKYGLTEIGFWLITPAQNQSQVALSYTLPISPDKYSLTILKQHGLVSSPQTIQINQKNFSTSLTNDYLLQGI